MLSWIMSSNSIAIVLDNEIYNVESSWLTYSQIIDELKQATPDENKLKELLSIQNALEPYSSEIVVDKNHNVILYRDKPLHNTLVTKILEMLKEGFNVKPMIRFLENLMNNPSMSSINELYTFLEHKGLPITEDGCFIAYKGVTNDLTDCHTRSVDNSPGAKPKRMERNEVDDNRNSQCSHGYHVGSFEYASTFGPRMVLVKVNPADVVSVPLDCNCQKVRVCYYEVIDEPKRKEILTSPVFEIIKEDSDTNIDEESKNYDNNCHSCNCSVTSNEDEDDDF
jgi:hypothetical protein